MYGLVSDVPQNIICRLWGSLSTGAFILTKSLEQVPS